MRCRLVDKGKRQSEKRAWQEMLTDHFNKINCKEKCTPRWMDQLLFGGRVEFHPMVGELLWKIEIL